MSCNLQNCTISLFRSFAISQITISLWLALASVILSGEQKCHPWENSIDIIIRNVRNTLRGCTWVICYERDSRSCFDAHLRFILIFHTHRIFGSYNFLHRLKQRLGNNDAWVQFHKADDNTNGNGIDEDETSDEENENQAQFKSFKPIGPSSTFDFDNQFKSLPKEKMKLSRRGGGRRRGKK